MWKHVIKAVVIAGSLDIVAAFAQAYMRNKVAPDVVLKYIASGWFGKDAYSGGIEYSIFGLFIHVLIVFACTLSYFLMYPKLKILHKSIWPGAMLLAIIAWTVTTSIIIPLSKIETPPFNVANAIIAILILLFCVGLPIAFIAAKFYKNIAGN